VSPVKIYANFDGLNEAVLFAMLKDQIDKYIEEYTDQNPPPPYQIYTVMPSAGTGNMHMVQKVFEGAFEVGCFLDT
jgi:mannosyl-oligosaccharide glucosidase